MVVDMSSVQHWCCHALCGGASVWRLEPQCGGWSFSVEAMCMEEGLCKPTYDGHHGEHLIVSITTHCSVL